MSRPHEIKSSFDMRVWLLSLPRPLKRSLAIGLDAGLCAAAVWIAMAVRLERVNVPWEPWLVASMASVGLALPLFLAFGLYSAIFRHSGVNVTVTIAKAMALYAIAYMLVFTVFSRSGIPRSTGLTQPLLLYVFVSVSRLWVSAWLGELYRSWWSRSRQPGVLVYGAGAAGRQLASVLSQGNKYRVAGFLDDDKFLHGYRIDGHLVHAPDRLGPLVPKMGIKEVVLAIPSASSERRRDILRSLREHAVHVRSIPDLNDITTGKVRIEELQELQINDLLWRDTVVPEPGLLEENIAGKVVLVTGAGGSIGSELCRQILRLGPKRLVLMDVSEFGLYAIHHELQAAAGLVVPVLGSVLDVALVDRVFGAYRPDTVFHAAAYKHVPLVEQNVVAGLRTNVWGTWYCAQAALRHGTQCFVLVSTDKAVRPTNVMGTSKRLAEIVLQTLAAGTVSARTRFVMVRFGNVLGSSGSVVPLFRKQINLGGPVTVTHPEVTRYFMTIPEAAELVIQASALGTGGEVFVLDMGESVRIIDLARRMIELSGLSVKDESHPFGEIEIKITGLRPGEKLYEELLIGENPQPTRHPRICRSMEPKMELQPLHHLLDALEDAMQANDVPAIRKLLHEAPLGYDGNGHEVADELWKEAELHAARTSVTFANAPAYTVVTTQALDQPSV